MAGISPARKAAFNVLMAVERGQSHSDDLLRGKLVALLSPADRNLTTALVLGVLRWQIRLDGQLKPLFKHPNAKIDPEIRIALRLGAFQLLHMDRIPARAAIDESVELAKQAGHRFASGMVNAVLRKLAAAEPTRALQAAEKRHEVSGHDFSRAESFAKSTGALAAASAVKALVLKDTGLGPYIAQVKSTRASAPEGCKVPSPAVALALAQGHPAWMVERWAGFFGLEAAGEICRHGQAQPVPIVRLTGQAIEVELTASGIVLEPGELLTAARKVIVGDLTATAAFREGRARLQDEGSQLVAEIAGQGSTILDCCAAPGGKTLVLAERNPDARIVAGESSAPRLAELRTRLASLGDRIECRLADATALEDESVFDLVLADVPCSGTGTLGRNPEIRHRLKLEDLARHAERQRAILRAALRAVRPGGRVVYSTCSLEPEENEQIIAAVLKETPGVQSIHLAARVEQLCQEGALTATGAERLQGAVTPQGALHLLPGAFETDGFFICLLERTPENTE